MTSEIKLMVSNFGDRILTKDHRNRNFGDFLCEPPTDVGVSRIHFLNPCLSKVNQKVIIQSGAKHQL